MKRSDMLEIISKSLDMGRGTYTYTQISEHILNEIEETGMLNEWEEENA